MIFNNPNFLDKHNWSMGWGYMPTKDNEFLLTDYALFSMYTMSPHYLDELLGVSYVSLKSDEGLINAINGIDEDQKITIFGDNYEVLGEKAYYMFVDGKRNKYENEE